MYVCFELWFWIIFLKSAIKTRARESITKKRALALLLTSQHSDARSFFEINKVNWVLRLLRIGITERGRLSRERTSTSVVFSVLTFLIIIVYDFKKIIEENSVQKSEFYILRMSQRRYVNLRSSCWCRMEFHKKFFAIWTFEIIIVNWSSKILFHFSTIKHDILNYCSQFYISISHHISDTILLFSKSLVWISFVSQFFTWTEIADVLREKNQFFEEWCSGLLKDRRMKNYRNNLHLAPN